MRKNLLDLLDEIRAIAQLGLNYTNDPYDIERYKRLLELSSNEYANITNLSKEKIKDRFSQELGYITPKVGVQGIVINNDGNVLLDKRKDDSLWGLPSGWGEVGETPEQTIKREFLEETSLNVKPSKVLGMYTRLPGQYSQPHTSIHILYYCEVLSGELKKSHESIEVKFVDYTTIKEWHKDHKQQVEKGVKYWKENYVQKRL